MLNLRHDLTNQMNITDLTYFCKSWGDLSLPFHFNNFVYATDGSLAVRIPVENFEGPLPENGTRDIANYAGKLDSYFEADLSGQESHILSDFDFDLETEICTHCEGDGVLYSCDECDGSGEISYSTEYNDYENECESCDGKAYFRKSDWEEQFPGSDITETETEECELCDGTGVLCGNPDIYIGKLHFQGKLLKKFMQFEGAVIFTLDDISHIPGYTNPKPARIKWGKGEGILMPMSRA